MKVSPINPEFHANSETLGVLVADEDIFETRLDLTLMANRYDKNSS